MLAGRLFLPKYPRLFMSPRLASLIARALKTDAASVTAASGPDTIPAWDSAGHLNLILELEKEFGVQFDDDEVVEMISGEAIAAALARHGAQL